MKIFNNKVALHSYADYFGLKILMHIYSALECRATYAVIILSLILSSCGKSDNNQTSSFSNTAMTMEYKVLIGKDLTPEERNTVQRLINTVFNEINEIYNDWNPLSELSLLNKLPAGLSRPISGQLTAFLEKTGKIVNLTEGKFDPTVAPLLDLWKSRLRKGIIPSQEEIDAASAAVGWNLIHIENGKFWKDHDFVRIDLGGIVKGYAIDLIVERLNDAGLNDVFVEWGGEIRASGKHPEGRPWRVSIPLAGGAIAYDLQDQAVASSGDYFQNWTVEGTTYFHIINISGKSPLIATKDSVCSATIAAETCMLADALATAVMIFPSLEESEKWLKNIPEETKFNYWISNSYSSLTSVWQPELAL